MTRAHDRRDHQIGLRASGPDKGLFVSCAYCGREMAQQSIAAHVAAKHPRRRLCA